MMSFLIFKMADVARTAVVSNENHNGLIVEDSVKKNQSDDSNVLTECSVPNITNNCSDRNSCYEAKDGIYKEIDSFSELSFKTTDEISLQDIIESEFAARISNINGDDFPSKTIDDCWNAANANKSHDPFDDLFENYNNVVGKKNESDGVANDAVSGEIKLAATEISVKEKKPIEEKDQVDSNLDDFISGPMHGDTSFITEYEEEEEERAKDGGDDDAIPNHGIITKSVNIFKLDRNEDILPVLTNFDPFTAIEEDSEDCSNPLTNSDILNSPADESPFSQSLEKTKDWENAGEPTLKIIEETNGESNDVVIVNKSNDVMRKLFTQTISNENSDDFTEQNYEQENDEEGSKLCVDESMNAARSQNNFITPNPSSFVSIDKIEVDEFFSSEDIPKGFEENKNINETECEIKNLKITTIEHEKKFTFRSWYKSPIYFHFVKFSKKKLGCKVRHLCDVKQIFFFFYI